MKAATLDKLIWTLVYGGLLILSLGIFVQRAHDPLGWMMVVAGLVLVVAGAVLVWVRSKTKETP